MAIDAVNPPARIVAENPNMRSNSTRRLSAPATVPRKFIYKISGETTFWVLSVVCAPLSQRNNSALEPGFGENGPIYIYPIHLNLAGPVGFNTGIGPMRGFGPEVQMDEKGEARGLAGYGIDGPGLGWPLGTRGWTRVEP
ncbi:hypothetical protein C8J57DRAFT_1238565 [Mycena rebaudengoi]|nr:hypothetical protein C8J57DRAFT_1238565 [Mycena rebaudengoi]